ncbi:uncharacterized protein LOC124408692 [Diprion similis]|uniref:uncharacterized protein LOC124408692 n=1 Tax=Diprion similis TaxID=362088 RepID=UPI001EF9A32A|nr:uncharacterized protein LOC124408692 [Diprion similis]
MRQRHIDQLKKIIFFMRGKYFYETHEVFAREKCEINGGSTAYDTAIRGLESFNNSIHSMLNAIEINLSHSTSNISEDLTSKDEDFEEICRDFHTWEDVVTLAVDAFKPCWDLDERQSAEIVMVTMSRIIEHVCENNGSRLLAYSKAPESECFIARTDRFRACYRNYVITTDIVAYKSVPFTKNREIPIPFRVPVFKINLKECSGMDVMHKCFVRELDTCKEETRSNLINSIFNIITKELGCEALLNKTPATHTTY